MDVKEVFVLYLLYIKKRHLNWKNILIVIGKVVISLKPFLDKTKDNKDTYDNFLNNIKKLMKYKDSFSLQVVIHFSAPVG
ncbi:MAG: hypothetical protein ACXW07_01290 [Nitrososphaeraceae archaeon]